MVRAAFIDENGVKKGAWSQEEDDKLKAYIQKYGHWNWRELPKFAGLSRCGKSCRLRWMNYLRPGVKHGNYSKEEEDMIIELRQKFGNKWSKIAAKLAGRTDNEIKNYWHTNLKKRTRTRTRTRDSECESTSGSEAKQNSSTDQNEDHMIVESSVRNMPSHLILESSPLSPVSSSTEIPQLTCDSATASNWIAEDTSSDLYEGFEYCSGDFWTEPFITDQDNYRTSIGMPAGEELVSFDFTNYQDGTDLFYQVMNELPGN